MASILKGLRKMNSIILSKSFDKKSLSNEIWKFRKCQWFYTTSPLPPQVLSLRNEIWKFRKSMTLYYTTPSPPSTLGSDYAQKAKFSARVSLNFNFMLNGSGSRFYHKTIGIIQKIFKNVWAFDWVIFFIIKHVL